MIAGILLTIYWPKSSPVIQSVEVEYAKVAPRPLRAVEPIVPKKKEIVVPKKAVYGISRKSVTDEKEGVEAKQGNTVVKTPDDRKLKDTDPDSLPIPVDEYLVTEMPAVLKEVRAPYPEEAKKAGIEGAVVAELLIDEDGKVRQVQIVKGLGYGCDEAASKALMQYEFSPGKVEAARKAVKIQYTYRFSFQ